MRSNPGAGAVTDLAAALDALAAADPAATDNQQLRDQVLRLTTAVDRAHAELVRRIDVLDQRGACHDDGFPTTKSWLRAYTRRSGPAAHRLVRTARLLRHLPKLATAAQNGQASDEHLRQVARLADQVSPATVAEVESTLAEAVIPLTPEQLGVVCDRVAAHVDPDGPDPAAQLDRRGLTLVPVNGMMTVRGQLDPEAGAAVATALDALTAPPAADDSRTAAQRRADALADLARLHLASGDLPTVGGHRPQIGMLLYPQALSPETLSTLADAQRNHLTAYRLQQLASDTIGSTTTGRVATGRVATGVAAHPDLADNTTRPRGAPAPAPAPAPPAAAPRAAAAAIKPSAAEAPAGPTAERPTGPPTGPPANRPSAAAWTQPGWNDPPWLNWHGAIHPATAQRIACDADVFRLILDPTTGMPLDLGRTHRLVPHWLRKALHARDRGCRWPGCATPTEWTDAHHLTPWADGGTTNIHECVLLCRYHHTRVHEAGWTIHLNSTTGDVTVQRPGGIPYQPSSTYRSWNGPTARAP